MIDRSLHARLERMLNTAGAAPAEHSGPDVAELRPPQARAATGKQSDSSQAKRSKAAAAYAGQTGSPVHAKIETCREAFCVLHQAWMEPQEDDQGTYFAHELTSGRWCNGGTRRQERKSKP